MAVVPNVCRLCAKWRSAMLLHASHGAQARCAARGTADGTGQLSGVARVPGEIQKPTTSVGVCRSICVPSPTVPSRLYPQHFAPPELISAQAVE